MFREKNYRTNESQEELDERVVQIDRVTRVVKGGRRLRFRATVVVGDRAGKIGVGVAKGSEVVTAITKAVAQAKKKMIQVNLSDNTIPHEIEQVFCGARVFLKPASEGTGVIAGGAVRAVVEVAGVKDILTKMIGSSNKVNNVYATFEALKNLQSRPASKPKVVEADPKTTKPKEKTEGKTKRIKNEAK